MLGRVFHRSSESTPATPSATPTAAVTPGHVTVRESLSSRLGLSTGQRARSASLAPPTLTVSTALSGSGASTNFDGFVATPMSRVHMAEQLHVAKESLRDLVQQLDAARREQEREHARAAAAEADARCVVTGHSRCFPTCVCLCVLACIRVFVGGCEYQRDDHVIGR